MSRGQPHAGPAAWLRRAGPGAAWGLLAAPGLWQLGLLAYAVAHRVGYPYDLEWMEGGLLAHAARLAEGQGIYVAPSVAFIPYLYTPLYPGLVALAGALVGLSYQVGRAVSVAAMAGVLACMAAAILRGAHARDRAPALCGAALAGGLFAATYPWVEGWYDIVRADTLFLAMILAGLLILTRGPGARDGARGFRPRPGVVAAAAILGLSFFCKQTGIFYVAVGGALVLARDWRQVPTYVAVSGVIGLGGTALINHLSGGWFWTYIYEVHQVHDFNMDRFYQSFGNILWKFPAMTLVVAAALVAVAVTAAITRRLPRSAVGLLTWSAVFAVSCVVGAVGWGTQWAHFNAYMPAMTTGALACGAAVPALAGAGAAWRERGASMPRLGQVAGAVAALAVGWQLYHARWSPRRFIPTERDRAAGDALIERLRELRRGGDVFVPYHPWYARLAGQQQTYAHRMGLLDMTYGNRWQVRGLKDALEEAAFAAVVLDNRPVGRELAGLRRGYRLDDLLPRSMAPRVYTGAQVVPRSVWRPIDGSNPDGAQVLFDFEDGSFAGWTVDGRAWGRRPVTRPVRRQGPVAGYRGRYFADSMHGGDRATGILTSPAFAITGERITLRMSGGNAAERLRAELRVGDQTVRTAVNDISSERMREHTWDVAELAGQTARIVFIDRATGGWGHLNVDHVLLWEE